MLTVVGLLCAALGTALADQARSRRFGAAGLLLLGLAVAAWGAGSPPEVEPMQVARLGRGFLVGNGGLLALGTLLVVVGALDRPRDPLQLAARLLVAGGLVLLGPVLIEFLSAAGPLRAAGAALALGLIGAALAVGLRAIVGAAPVRAAARRLAGPPLLPALRDAPLRNLALLALAAAVGALGPHLGLLFIAVIVAAWAGYLGFQPRGMRPVPVAPVLTLLLLPSYWLLATIAGPFGLGTAGLSDVPLSPAAELLVAPALLLSAWATAGLWPLHRQLPGPLVAPVGALLLVRAGLPLVPEGLEYWRPVAVPLVWLGLWQAAGHGRWPLLASGTGVLALVASSAVAPAAAGLLATGLALEIAASARPGMAQSAAVRAPAWAVGAWCGLRVMEEALRGEVVYTALGAAGLALIVAAGSPAASGETSPAR